MSNVGFYEIDPASGDIDCSAVVNCHVGDGGAGFVHDGQGCAFVHVVMQFAVCTIYPDAGEHIFLYGADGRVETGQCERSAPLAVVDGLYAPFIRGFLVVYVHGVDGRRDLSRDFPSFDETGLHVCRHGHEEFV